MASILLILLLFASFRVHMKLFLDWSSYKDAGMGDAYADIPKTGDDYAKAIAVCIASHACETKDRGVMCPSYRVSEKTEFSTGGRVKLLKAALNGELGQTPFNHPELAEAMDLCVSCKGCKRECENEVDMALIKAEFMAQRFSETGVPRRNRVFAEMPKFLHYIPKFPSLIRWRNRSPKVAQLGEKFLGISAAVKLPEPAIHAFSPEKVKHNLNTPSEMPRIVLFVDTFNRHFNPAVAEAAISVLSAAGYDVSLLEQDASQSSRPLCCGRTYFANGMIEQARQEAQRLLHALTPHLAADTWIIGLEPSCILSLRDEHLKLNLGDKSKQLAERVVLFEEFIAKEITAKRWSLTFNELTDQTFLVHGHCHQKAVGAIKAMRKVLKLIPKLNSRNIESSCCGMAGQFGLEAEHVEMATQMAEQGLYPAIKAEPESTVIANGFSCQQQIINGGFAKPLHIAEILNAALVRD